MDVRICCSDHSASDGLGAHRSKTQASPQSLLYNIATQWTVWLALYPLFKFRLNDSAGGSLAFVAMLLLRETLCRAVLAAASPSLLGPSLLQEGSEAEDMVSLTVPNDSK